MLYVSNIIIHRRVAEGAEKFRINIIHRKDAKGAKSKHKSC
jgi:hypothetical protein